MIHKSRVSALLAVTALGISTAESALAMPADYCAAYATSAVQEFNHAIHDPACPAVSGGRWHANYDRHYKWRLQNSNDAVTREWGARRHFLRNCG
jgi:hypothetical protein